MMKPVDELDVSDWLTAGFRALVQHGAAGMRAEAVAADLGVGTAAFHRHFVDFAAFRAEMLADWAAQAYGALMAEVEAEPGPTAKLRRLAMLLVDDRDVAVRAWARSDAVVAQALAEMDARRLNAVKAVCLAAGISHPEVPLLIYATAAGYAGLRAEAGRAEAGMLALLRLTGAGL